jgi:glycogenin glucosyltransferase
MPQAVALCFLVASPYFGRFWRYPLRNSWQVARRTAGALPILHRLRDRNNFHLGLQVAIASIRHHAASVPPILLLSPEPIAPPPGVDIVIPIDPIPFEAARRCNFALGGLSTYFKLALFAMEGWERIVYVDTDTVALGDLSKLWDPQSFADKAIYAVRETAEMGPWRGALGKLNTGVMVVNAPMLNRRVYAGMLQLAREGHSYDGGDQGIINTFLLNHGAEVEAGELPEAYNVFVNDRIQTRWPLIGGEAKVLHFVGRTKPWSRYYERACPYGREFKACWDEVAAGVTG